MPFERGAIPHNRLDRTNQRYGKLVAVSRRENYWLCRCDCGNEVAVLSTNLAAYAKGDRGCKNCAHRQDITGEERGLLRAESCETGAVKGRAPLWTFRCRCGGSIQGTVREFRANFIRSCGCHDSAYSSWVAMMARCYDPKHNRYKNYGRRGVVVCERWHDFENFVADMGERPKRHTISRKEAEGNYEPSNCIWEHISLNGPDTYKGKPTISGLKKGAKARNVIED